jgi:hypothetical protein
MADENDGVKIPTQAEIDAQIAALVAEQIKEIKGKLDASFTARDEAVRKATQLEEAARKKELEDLTAAGKHAEVAQLKMTALEENLKIAQGKITSYERDSVVKDALRAVKFRNDRSAEMAYRDVVDQLVQNQEGQWVHKTGVSIKDYIGNYTKDEQNSFLFEPKVNSGGGSGPAAGTPKIGAGRKITDLNTQEILAAATAGELGAFKI